MNQEPGNTIGNLDVILIHRHTHSLNVLLSFIVPFTSFFFTVSISPYKCTFSSLLYISLLPPLHFTLKCIPINHVSRLLLCFFSILSPVSPARLVTACESGCEDALWQGKPSFPLLSQLTVQDFSSGQEREEEEIQGLLLIEITQGFLEAWAWGPPSFIQGLKGLIFFSQSQKGLGPWLMLQLGVS